jgi:hypothetical protein
MTRIALLAANFSLSILCSFTTATPDYAILKEMDQGEKRLLTEWQRVMGTKIDWRLEVALPLPTSNLHNTY